MKKLYDEVTTAKHEFKEMLHDFRATVTMKSEEFWKYWEEFMIPQEVIARMPKKIRNDLLG